MPSLFWDASALGKRYANELGSSTVNELWASGSKMLTTVLGYSEVYAILVRRLNAGRIDSQTFGVQLAALLNLVLRNATFEFLAIDDAIILRGLKFIRDLALNATDAAILSEVLEYRNAGAAHRGRSIALVASDRAYYAPRFRRASSPLTQRLSSRRNRPRSSIVYRERPYSAGNVAVPLTSSQDRR